MGLFDRLFARKSEPGPDGFSAKSNGPLADTHSALSEYLDQSLVKYLRIWETWDPRYADRGKALLDEHRESHSVLIAALIERLRCIDTKIADYAKRGLTAYNVGSDETDYAKLQRCNRVLEALLTATLAKSPPAIGDDIAALMRWINDREWRFSHLNPFATVVKLAELSASNGMMTPVLGELFVQFRAQQQGNSDPLLIRKLEQATKTAGNYPIESGEAWSDAALHDLAALPPDKELMWGAVLDQCLAANAANPTGKWQKRMSELLANSDTKEEMQRAANSWFPLVAKSRTATRGAGYYQLLEGSYQMSDGNMDILRGLAWTCGLIPDKELARSLTSLALTCFKKIPGIGPRATRVGNACITALGMMGTDDALGQLALLKVKVKFAGAQAAIEKTLNKLAGKLGVSREDLEEMSVPAYGMTDVGLLTQSIGEFTAELRIVDSRHTELVWKRADGKPQKAIPATVKQEHAEDVKELLAAKKDIEKMLPTQAERLDDLYLQRKTWPLAIWRERYLDHPLVGALARRLIWNFTTGAVTTPGVWLKDRLVDRSGHPVPLDDAATVSLWHPLDQPVDVVLGWRGFLEEWEIVQPFKQAHREVYLLTPAEEQTRVYSNRFAAHLLRQHQFNALCAVRGWKSKLRLMVDADYPPATRWLPQWNLRAEYWIEGAGGEYEVDTLESGAFRYVTTDQVRLYQTDAAQLTSHAFGGGYGPSYNVAVAEPLPLSEIPPLVFSEIMRDVDLFVGVASVGNDPSWLDGGTNQRHRGYWSSVSFGELNTSAQTRKAILERLVPKLKIASQCSFSEKFLIVQGQRHAYKIHLGSGNILIAPQDKYLCIVPAQAQVDKAGDKVFLPFEGDRVLSIILSKAFLLAADDKITDSTILRQL